MITENNVVHVNFAPQFEDIYGVDNDDVAVVLQHNKRTNELKFEIVTKDNKKSIITIDSIKGVGLMIALEEALDSQNQPKRNK
jgi:ribosomal protein L23